MRLPRFLRSIAMTAHLNHTIFNVRNIINKLNPTLMNLNQFVIVSNIDLLYTRIDLFARCQR